MHRGPGAEAVRGSGPGKGCTEQCGSWSREPVRAGAGSRRDDGCGEPALHLTPTQAFSAQPPPPLPEGKKRCEVLNQRAGGHRAWRG